MSTTRGKPSHRPSHADEAEHAKRLRHDYDDRATTGGVDVLDEAVTAAAFFKTYVGGRRPCLLRGAAVAALVGNTTAQAEASFWWRQLLSNNKSGADDDKEDSNNNEDNDTTTGVQPPHPPLPPHWLDTTIVQVEVRSADANMTGFGQARTAATSVNLTVRAFLNKLQDPDPAVRGRYYLSTQELRPASSSNDSNDDDDDTTDRPYDTYSSLTAHLVARGVLPSHMPLAGHLVLHACQLWMGGDNVDGSCSGLHHDFHDNWYFLAVGRKRLHLYPPVTPLPVVGELQHVHPNGLRSYAAAPTRADGVPLSLIPTEGAHHDKVEEDGTAQHASDDDDDDDEDEESVVLGKGFDYQSDKDDDDEDDEPDVDWETMDATRDDFDALVDGTASDSHENRSAVPPTTASAKPRRPDHFSPVNLDSPTLYEDYPAVRQYEPLIVRVQAGEMLYLPASWWHCVWSYTTASSADEDAAVPDDDDDEPVHPFHLATNYWYHPPDQLDSFTQPYKDDFWAKQQQQQQQDASKKKPIS
jgi:hypothetical protein